MRPTLIPPAAVVAGVTTFTAAALVWRLGRSESSVARGLRPIAVVLTGAALATALAASPAGAAWRPPAADAVTRRVVPALSTAVSVPWLRFGLRYTGRDRLAGPRLRLGLAAAFVCLAAAGAVTVRAGGPTPESLLTLGAATGLLTAQGVVAVVAVTVAWGSVGDTSVPLGQGVGLAGAAVGPTVVGFLPGVGFPTALATTVGLLWAVVARYDPFERVPAARRIGRDRVVAEMSAAVVVAGDDGVVRDLDATAESVFGTPAASAVGEPLSAVAPSLAAGCGATFRARTEAGRDLTVSATPVTDDRGDRVGRLFVCRDVTDRRRRERRLRLLTQLLADTVHDRMRAVATAATDGRENPPEAGDDRLPAGHTPDPGGTATALTTVVSRVRDVERALADGGDGEPAALSALLADATDGRATGPDDGVVVAGTDAPLVQTSVELLAETAGEATVTTARTTDGVEIQVAGDPPADETAAEAAVAVSRIAAETLGGSLTERRGDDWRVTVAVPVRDGLIAAPPRRGGR